MITRVSLTMKLGKNSSVTTEARNVFITTFSKCRIHSLVLHWVCVCLTQNPELHACPYPVSKLHRLYSSCLYKWWISGTIFHYCTTPAALKGSNKLSKTDAKPLFLGKYVHMNEAFHVFRRSLLLLYKHHLLHKQAFQFSKQTFKFVVMLQCKHTYAETLF